MNYPPVIKVDNGKSTIIGGVFNGKQICGGCSIAMFDYQRVDNWRIS